MTTATKTKPKRKPASSARASGIPKRWRDILLDIPGYDSERDRGLCKFDADAADHVVDFIETCCRHVKGELAGELVVLERWEKAIVGNLFGWKRPDGTRRYREALIYVARKQGKSTLAACLVLFMLFGDAERGAEIYSAAADRDQASLIYAIARGMVEMDSDLARRAKIYSATKCIEYQGANNLYRAISAEAGTKHGYNSHFVVIDELHAQPNRDLVDVLTTSTGSRTQALIVHITTADFDRESICNEKHDYACKVRDGIIDDPSFLPVIYEAGRDDDWTDPKVWAKANPNLGVSISLEYLERECKRAQATPTYENTFKRLHLNMKTSSNVAWMAMVSWDACDGEVNEDQLRGRRCFGGLDLASKKDIAACVWVFPPTDDDTFWRVLPRFWVPGENAEIRERQDRVPYVTWGRQGFIELTDGPRIDYVKIRQQVTADIKRFDVVDIGADPWNLEHLRQEIDPDGERIIEFGQNLKNLSAPFKQLEVLVAEGRIAHAGHPVLRWMVSNCQAYEDGLGNIRPDKTKSTERIDGVVALTMAIGRSMVTGEKKASVWERHGVRCV